MRNDIPSIKELDTPALYILLNRETRQAYIGQTDSFAKRIAQHQSKKEFWDEVLAFVASDFSINATEVQYLEAIAYEKAKLAATYDLSPNSQEPKPHKVQQLTIDNTLDFFKVVCELTNLVGCDIFIPRKAKKGLLEPQRMRKPSKEDIQENETLLKGPGVRMYLNGKGPYKKNRFAFEVIREYLDNNPGATIQDLRDVFPTEILGNWKAWELIEPDIESARNLPSARHFLDNDSILVSPGDKIPFVVSSQWDYHNLPEILLRVKSFGWSYEISQKKSH